MTASLQRPPLRVEPRRPRIVVSDDDPDTVRWLEAALRREGLDAIDGGSGSELMSLISQYPYGALRSGDIIVTDVRMPGHTGLDVLLEIQRRRLPIPVILISGFTDRINRALALAGGCIAFLEKPFRAEALVSILKRFDAPTLRGVRRPLGPG